MAIEDWNDHTPNYHKTSDQLESLNLSYYNEFVKAALATFAHMGCLPEGYLAGTIRDSLSGNPIPGAKIEALREDLPPISKTAESNGDYQFTLQPGNYTIQFSAIDHLGTSFPNTFIQQNLTTTINPVLVPCVFIKQPHIDMTTNKPAVGELVNFNASAEGGEPPLSFEWDFGDGTTGSGASVSHTYDQSGAFQVNLTVNNPCGVPKPASTVLFVDMELVFLPIASTSIGP
jgi:hypothetical protein